MVPPHGRAIARASELRQDEMISKLKSQLSYLTNPPLTSIENCDGNKTDDDLTEDNEPEESDTTSQLNTVRISEVSNAASEYQSRSVANVHNQSQSLTFQQANGRKK